MQLYVEMMALAFLDSDFLKKCQTNPYDVDAHAYASVSRQIENRLCTNRESLLGSGAWRQDFMTELQFRPFYMVSYCGSLESSERCSICNRSAQNANQKVHLFGTRYDARKMYDVTRWDKVLPEGFLTVWNTNTNTSAGSDRKKGSTVEAACAARRCLHHSSSSSSSSGHYNDIQDNPHDDADDVIFLSDSSDDESDECDSDAADREASSNQQTLHQWQRLLNQWPTELSRGSESVWPAAV